MSYGLQKIVDKNGAIINPGDICFITQAGGYSIAPCIFKGLYRDWETDRKSVV